VSLVAACDDHERLWLPPAPVLFQRRIGAENRAIPATTIRKILSSALARTALTGPAGTPLHYTPMHRALQRLCRVRFRLTRDWPMVVPGANSGLCGMASPGVIRQK